MTDATKFNDIKDYNKHLDEILAFSMMRSPPTSPSAREFNWRTHTRPPSFLGDLSYGRLCVLYRPADEKQLFHSISKIPN
jgi:hypothetical protein